jgi:hypothetical protein
MDQKGETNAGKDPGDFLPRQASLAPAYFSINNREVVDAGGSEEAEALLAEYDFLFYYTGKIGALLGFRKTYTVFLNEEQTLLAFQEKNPGEIRGVQCSRPYPLEEALSLF